MPPARHGKGPGAALFRNNRDGTFTDVTAGAASPTAAGARASCAGDYDNDGDADLYVTNFGRNRLYRNDGRGRFEDVAGAAGLSVDGWSTGCAFADYDGDGRLDLFVAGYITLDLDSCRPRPRGRRAAGAPAQPETHDSAAWAPPTARA